MKVFISWSGDKSFMVAQVLKEWIPCVIQNVEPYFSSADIDKGARWSTDIAKELETAEFGILCVTKDNLDSTWLNFEAGALSKAVDKSKVCPFLFDLKPSDISKSPILQFQMTNVDRDDIFKLFQSINKCSGGNSLDETMLLKTFELAWDKINKALNDIEINYAVISNANKKKTENNNNNILEEMLDLLRYQQVILSNPERILPPEYLVKVTSQQKIEKKIDPRLFDKYYYSFRVVKELLCKCNEQEYSEEFLKYLNDFLELSEIIVINKNMMIRNNDVYKNILRNSLNKPVVTQDF